MSSTTKEKIEVMEASNRGASIEIMFKGVDIWEDCPNPQWDWNMCEYRIKPETKYRPFKNSAELVDWWEKHYQDKKRPEYTMPLVWVHLKDDDSTRNACFITEFWNDGVIVGSNDSTTRWQDLFENYTFLDGKPCGVEES